MNERDTMAARFEEHRGHLRAIAYRMLGSMADADDAVQEAWGLDAVHDTDRAQPPPQAGDHPGVDLKVQMTVRITRAGGVVAHHRRLQLFDRDLHLPAPRTHPGGSRARRASR